MKNIFVILSPSIPEHLIKNIGPKDIVLLGQESEYKHLKADFRSVKTPKFDQLKKITDQLAKGINEIQDDYSRDLMSCFINDFYSYTIKPIYCIFYTLKKIIKESGNESITIVCAKHSGKQIPMLGFKTLESKRGSALLFGAYLGSQLPKVFPDIQFQYKYVRRDVFCIEGLRRFIIKGANLFFSGNFLIKSLWLSLKFNDTKVERKKLPIAVIIRVKHQARFATKLIQEGKIDGVSLFLFPQLSQGSFSSLKEMLNRELKGELYRTSSVSTLIKGLQATLKDIKHLSKLKKEISWININTSCCGIAFDFQLRQILNEISLMSVVLLYKNILKNLLVDTNIQFLINFELVGKIAGVEALVARQSNITLKTVQTALVSSSPNVIFPASPVFYSDSVGNVESLNKLGSIKKGVVKYIGAPFILHRCKPTPYFSNIVFFTQPYEKDITLSILEKIATWGRKKNIKIIIKLHPRDEKDIYSKLVYDNPKIFEISRASPLSLFKISNLCMTKTSSVAKEAFAFGLPVILCLWSETDKTIDADYTSKSSKLKYISYNESDLYSLLNSPRDICHAAKIMNEELFLKKGISDMTDEIFMIDKSNEP